MTNYTPDQKDRAILNLLQVNAQITHSELSRAVGLSQSGVQKRLRKLEEHRLVKQYTAVINRDAFGYDLVVFVQVTLHGHSAEAVAQFDRMVHAMPEILECHRLLGSADYLLKVIVKNRDQLDHFLMKQLLPLDAVERVSSNLVLKSVKETTVIELTEPN